MDANQLNMTVLSVLAAQDDAVGQEARIRLDSMSEGAFTGIASVPQHRISLSRLRSDLRRSLEVDQPDLDAAYRIQRKLRELNDESAEAHFLTAVLYARAVEARRTGRGVPKGLNRTMQPLALELSYALSLGGGNPTYERAYRQVMTALPYEELAQALKRAGVHL